MARAPKKQIVTKKHLARIERERLQSRYIMIASIAIVVVVVGLITYGLLAQYVFQPLQPVASVDGEKISIRDFQQMARFQQYQIYNQYQQTLQLAQLFASDPSTNSYVSSSLAQLQSQYQNAFVGQAVIDQMIEDKLVRKEAQNLGITISADAVEKGIQEAFGYFPAGTPTVEPTLATQPTSTFSPLQMTLVPPTPTFAALAATEVFTPTPTPEFTATPTLAPSATPTSAPTATPTEYTQEGYQNDFNEFVQTVAEMFNLTEDTLKHVFENQLYRQKVMEAVMADTKPEQEQVWARHILVADEETAKLVITRLQNGEDFASLARELSTDSSSVDGGDLGWFGAGMMVAEFESVAFNLAIGEVSEPVQSSSGWHIIQVLGHENRPLDSYDFNQYRQQKFQEWLDGKRAAAQIETLNFVEYVPVPPALPEANLSE